ncbi:MAG: GGDEF domain-containing protein [Myxococcales bacterium]|nr:GGDEF domain-containing protein [Myxococcales bacterium]MCB9708308.1 GGDEF domain-containing protein [Myxococcales bacterium]
MAHSDIKTRITPVNELVLRKGTGDDCLVIIYSPKPENLGKRCVFAQSAINIGRGGENQLVLESDSVSRRHCRIRRRGGLWTITDLNSTNGTYVNDVQIKSYALQRGDQLKVGDTIFKYLSGSDIESQYHEAIYRMTIIDGLTTTYNKRFIIETLQREISRARRHTRPLSLLMCDIDHFKYINDNYGHLAGDYVLKELVQTARAILRPDDVMGRYGGEEFVLVLPETDLPGAVEVAERMRKAIESHEFRFEGEPIVGQGHPGLTISVGATELAEGWSDSDFLKAADEKLYEAKRAGRNRSVG